MTKTKVNELMALARQWVQARTKGHSGSSQENTLRAALKDVLKPDNPITAFRQGLLYASKKYDIEFAGTFTANDVRIFLEMEDAELEDHEILDLLTK
jgi:hypothetical protein